MSTAADAMDGPALDPPSGDAPLMLSVSGLRGLVGRSITPAVAADYAAAFGTWIQRRFEGTAGAGSPGVNRPLVCLGRDPRPWGEGLAAAAAAGLTGVGCDVIDLGVVTTPTVGVMIGEHRAAGGMVVTASHNPIEWNGLKALDAAGLAPPPAEARSIIETFEGRRAAWAGPTTPGTIRRDDRAHVVHLERVLAAIDPGPIRAAGLTVVLDSVHGAGAVPGRMLLESLGCTIIHLGGEPDGHFQHPPEPVAEHLTELSEAVLEHGADVGFAQDPDADRLAVVDETGRFIGEEYTLVLAAMRVLSTRGAGPLAANLSTSRMIDDVAARFPGSVVHRTPVGEANVVAALRPAEGILGGEGNGGVILPEVCWVRDSLSAMALVLGLMAERREAARETLSAIVDGLPRYVMVKRKADLSAVGGRDAVGPMIERVKAAFAGERIDDADGVRVDLDEAWVHLRPSNTEPIVRLIAEGPDQAAVDALLARVGEAAGVTAGVAVG